MSLYVVTKITNRFIPYESTNECSVDLIGVFNNKEAIEQALKNLKLTKSEINIHEVKINEVAYNKNSSYQQDLTSLFGWLEEYNEYFENTGKIALIFDKK